MKKMKESCNTYMKNYIYIGDNEKIMNLKMPFLKDKASIIYIDPPYNTKTKKSYYDSEYTNNTWKDMMTPRLRLAREILKEEGVIFISIDDSQFANLKIICDTIFLEDNFLGVFITRQAQRSNGKHINTVHEYILSYAKNKAKLPRFEILRIEDPEDREMILNINKIVKSTFLENGVKAAESILKEQIEYYCSKRDISWLKNYRCVSNDGRVFFPKDLSTPGAPRDVEIPEIGLFLKALPTRGWSSEKKFINLFNENRLHFMNDRPYEITYLEESKDNVPSILNFFSRHGTNDLNKLGMRDMFDTPKPVDLIKYLINIYPGDNHVVLDFFAGSGTTAQAVLEINATLNKNHKFILIQLDEKFQEGSKQFVKSTELGIEPIISEVMIYRINKVIEVNKIKNENIIIERFGNDG